MASVFLEIDGIDGGSSDGEYGKKKAMDIESWSWGAIRATGSSDPTLGVGKVHDLHVSKRGDKSTPNLLFACLNNKPIKKATLSAIKTAAGKRVAFIVIKLENVSLSSYQVDGHGGEGTEIEPRELITLHFAKCTYTYTPVDKDLNPQGPVEATWSMEEGQK